VISGNGKSQQQRKRKSQGGKPEAGSGESKPQNKVSRTTNRVADLGPDDTPVARDLAHPDNLKRIAVAKVNGLARTKRAYAYCNDLMTKSSTGG